MRRFPPVKRVRKPRRRNLEPADLEDLFELHELEDWMTGGPGGK